MILNMADMLTDATEGTKHRDVRHTEIIRSEKCVVKAKEAVESFLNPFNVDAKDQLLILSSDATASVGVEKDVLQEEQVGGEAKFTFIETRLKQGKISSSQSNA